MNAISAVTVILILCTLVLLVLVYIKVNKKKDNEPYHAMTGLGDPGVTPWVLTTITPGTNGFPNTRTQLEMATQSLDNKEWVAPQGLLQWSDPAMNGPSKLFVKIGDGANMPATKLGNHSLGWSFGKRKFTLQLLSDWEADKIPSKCTLKCNLN